MVVKTASVEYPDDHEYISGNVAVRALESFARSWDEHSHTIDVHNVTDAVRACVTPFYELSGRTITVARLSPNEKDSINARAGVYNDIIYLPTDEYPTNMTITHECAHLVIYGCHHDGVDVPHTSEEFCSITAVSRMDVDMIDEPYISYLGYPSVDTAEWPHICREALEYRENNHNYIQYCKQELGITE